LLYVRTYIPNNYYLIIITTSIGNESPRPWRRLKSHLNNPFCCKNRPFAIDKTSSIRYAWSQAQTNNNFLAFHRQSLHAAYTQLKYLKKTLLKVTSPGILEIIRKSKESLFHKISQNQAPTRSSRRQAGLPPWQVYTDGIPPSIPHPDGVPPSAQPMYGTPPSIPTVYPDPNMVLSPATQTNQQAFQSPVQPTTNLPRHPTDQLPKNIIRVQYTLRLHQ